jgi:hypothetical protein
MFTNQGILDEAKEKEFFTLALYGTYLITAVTWGTCHLFLGIITTIAAAIASGSALSDNKNITVLASVIATILAAISTFLNPSEREKVHVKAANQFQELNDKYKLFIATVEKADTTDQVLMEQLEKLRNEFYQARNTNPISPGWAWQRALKKAKSKPKSHQYKK